MLVLSRKGGESVYIGDSIEVRIVEVGGGRVKLGFSAPRNVSIQRGEIHTGSPSPLTSCGRMPEFVECCFM